VISTFLSLEMTVISVQRIPQQLRAPAGGPSRWTQSCRERSPRLSHQTQNENETNKLSPIELEIAKQTKAAQFSYFFYSMETTIDFNEY
jgi:hypothetical protein